MRFGCVLAVASAVLYFGLVLFALYRELDLELWLHKLHNGLLWLMLTGAGLFAAGLFFEQRER